MDYWFLILIPLFTALTGWITVWVLIKMLFHPRNPQNILGIRFQGVFPKRQPQLAEKMGKLISGFLSFENIQEKISDPENLKRLMPMIEDHIDDFLRNRLGKEMPVIAMFVGDKTIGKLKESFMKEIALLFPQVMKQYATNMKEGFDIEVTVIKKIAGFSPASLEKMLRQAMSKEFRLAMITGAIVGFLLGLVQALIIFLTASGY